MIIDETNTGLGRTGKLFGINHYNVIPDIIVMSKNLSGGIYPVSATCFRDFLKIVFKEEPFAHPSTFGGSELGMEVAFEVVSLSSSCNFLSHVRDIADEFSKIINDVIIKKHIILISEFRQFGCLMAIKFKNKIGLLLQKIC